MSVKAAPAIFIAFALAFATLTCRDQADVTSPVEPQFAKTVKPTPVEPELEEFWVYRADDSDLYCPGGEVIHVVVSGDFIRLETAVTQDHWFNGIRDFLYVSGRDDHFEEGDRGPAQPETQWKNENGVTMGHIDVCFHGERVDFVHPGGEIARADFVDAPSLSVLGWDGADPFAFTVYAITEEKPFQPPIGKRFRPTGVVVGGVIGDPEEVTVTSSVIHGLPGLDNARSFAIWSAPDAPGQVSFGSLDLSASCQMATSTVGRGKKATQVTTTTVTAEVTFGFEVDGLPWPSDGNGWTEAHLRVSQGNEELFFSGAQRTLFDGPESSATYTWTVEGRLMGEVTVELLADNLVLDTGSDEFAYDPGNNYLRFTTAGSVGEPTTTAGFVGEPTTTNLWNASTNVSSRINDGKVPVVWSGATVTCH